MMKKDKNSELLVHYARTMTPENLSRAANYVGGYVLKGLGALGKIFTAPLTGGPLGPATVVLPKTKKLLDAERKLRKTQEELIGKAMTWVSPLNYGAALATGNGLNAKKGEEEVASWSPAWQAAARLGELYVGPKGVKIAKAAPRAVVNTAAKAGVKSAKTAVVAREIKLATKNKPNIEVSKPIIRTRVGDVEIDNPQLFYRQGSAEMGNDFIKSGVVKTSGGFLNPMYTEGALFKKIPTRTKGGLSKGDKIALEGPYNKTKSDLLVTDSSVNMIPANQGSGKNYTWFEDYMLDPFAEESIFDKSRVPLFNGTATSANTTAYRWEPGYGYKKVVQEPSTSLAFFERKPSKLTEAEKFGLNKHDRKLLSEDEQLALLDLALYKSSGQYRQVFRVTPDWENFGWNLDRSNPTFMLLFAKDGESMKGPWARVMIQSPTGKGVLAVNPERNMAGYTSRSFPVPEGMNWAPGEANMMIDGANGLKIILTAPRTDFFDAIVEKGSESIGEKLPNTIDKSIMKDFWINSKKVLRPGTYLSGDNGHAPKGSELIEAFKKRQLHKVDIKERPLNKLFVTRTGLSPDSYSSIIRQGNRDGSLRWGEGFNKWNNSAVENRFINEAFLKLQKGEITPEQYEEIFNNWSLNIGGRKLLWKDFNGHKIPIHPHPYIYAKKQGGKMNILEFLKNGSGINIKKKNRGKFTSYCGGKVTDECILKGKNSSNPAIRKRATFADNARHFKHRSGGVLYIFLEGGKTSWWNKAINFVNNSGLGEAALNALSTYTLNKLIGASSDVAKALVDKNKASRILQANLAAELEARDIQLNNINPENPNAMNGDIVKNFIKNKLLSLKMALINLESNLEKAEIDWQTLLLKNLNTMNTLSGIGNVLMQGLGHVGLYMGNKLLTNVNNT